MKRTLMAGAVIAGMFAAQDAAALELGTRGTEHPYSSPQNFALELRFGPYYPQIDEEPGLTGTPFKNAFGDKGRLYAGIEFDWQVLRIPYVGTIGPGLSVGTVSMSRQAVTKSGRESGDEYTLHIYPMSLSAVLRADTFWRDAGVPLVPYGKLGLGYGIWRASTTGGTSESNGVAGKGSSWGTNIALGLAFALDALDRGATRNMDNAIGINNTYVYAEYYWLALNGLGGQKALYVGSNSWVAGLAFEF